MDCPCHHIRLHNFADYLGFCHRKITPRHPESNAQYERFTMSLGKAIRASHTQNTCLRQDMYAFLRNYRATIHPSTKQPHCVLFYGRAINIKIPSIPMKIKAKNNHAKAKICDNKAKKKKKKKRRTMLIIEKTLDPPQNYRLELLF